MDVQKAWQKFTLAINDIKLRQDKIIRHFLEEVAKRKEEKIRQKINKL